MQSYGGATGGLMTLTTEEKHLDDLVQQLLKEHDPAGGRVEFLEAQGVVIS